MSGTAHASLSLRTAGPGELRHGFRDDERDILGIALAPEVR